MAALAGFTRLMSSSHLLTKQPVKAFDFNY